MFFICKVYGERVGSVRRGLPRHLHRQPRRLHDHQEPAHQHRYTVCPGSSDPPKKNLIYLHQKMRFTLFINYYDTLGLILLVYKAK